MGVALLVVVLGLTACSGEGSADPEDPTDPSSVEVTVNADDQASGTYTADPLAAQTPTGDAPEPSPYPKPERPAEMDDHGEKGAIAAAKYFFELYNYVQSTGETESFDEVATSQCTACTSLNNRIDEIYNNGGYMTGGHVSIQGVTARPTIDSLGWEVTYDLIVAPMTVVAADRTQDEYVATVYNVARMGTIIVDGTWQIIEMYSGS